MPLDPPQGDRGIANKLAARLAEEHYGTGPLAQLRRLDPAGSLMAPALQRLLVQYVDTDHPGRLRLWALFIHCLAIVSPQPAGAVPLGQALFEAGYNEGRTSRLLAARADDLAGLMPRTMRLLKAKGVAFTPVTLWDFLHATMTPALDGRWADDARTRLARAYYRAENATKGTAA